MPRRARRHAGVFPKKRFYALLISLIAYVFYLLFSPENSGELERRVDFDDLILTDMADKVYKEVYES